MTDKSTTTKDLLAEIAKNTSKTHDVAASSMKLLTDILNELKPHEIVILSNYPPEGKKAIGAGITVDLDTRTGEVTFSDHRPSELMTSNIPDDWCRSILMYVDAHVKLSLRKAGAIILESSVFPTWFRLSEIRFDRVRITALTTTNVYVVVSNEEVPSVEGAEMIYTMGQAIPLIEYYVYAESVAPVQVDVGETKKIVGYKDLTIDWILSEVGATDQEYSEYWLQVGTTESVHTKAPVGLFNAPHKLSPMLVVGKGVEAAYYVKRSAGATAPADYVGKLIGYKKVI